MNDIKCLCFTNTILAEKTFVTTNICRDKSKHTFVATNTSLAGTKVCRDKHVISWDKSMSRQTLLAEAATSILFVATNN